MTSLYEILITSSKHLDTIAFRTHCDKGKTNFFLKGHFEIFYWTHFLYSLFIILLLLHCDQSIIWLIIPMTLFVVNKFIMIKKWFDGSGKSYAVSGVLLPSKVTQLNIRRDTNLNFNPGDWVFINIPAISNFEWHPFTISSAPDQPDIFTLHIRSLGGWTQRLHSYFIEEENLMQIEGSDGSGYSYSRFAQIEAMFRVDFW